MKPKEIEPNESPLMALALANAAGCTKRQVQLWTDAGALLCFPETDRQGRGRQRLYPRSEIRFAAIAAALSGYGLPIGKIVWALSAVRAEMANRFGNDKYARWCRRAWAGDVESYFWFDATDDGFAWRTSKNLMNVLSDGRSGLVVPVHTLVKKYPDG